MSKTKPAGGVRDSFDKARHLLHEMAGVRLSESTVERTTEEVGQRLAAFHGQGIPFGPDVPWRWHHDAKGRGVAYVPLDASGTRQQGPGGRHAEGRMAYVGGIYNPPPPDGLRPGGPAPPLQARYVSGLYSMAQMGPLLRYQATAVGMEQAEVWVALSDGGNGLEALLQSHFNRADLVVILDFYHAASYVEALAHALHPDDDEPVAGVEPITEVAAPEPVAGVEPTVETAAPGEPIPPELPQPSVAEPAIEPTPPAGSNTPGNGGANPSAPTGNVPTGEVPSVIYREGRPSPSNLTPRPRDNGHLSFRDSLSNPIEPGVPGPLGGQRPVFRPGQDYMAIDTSKLPPGSVIPDGVPGSLTTPLGHVSVVDVPPEVLRNAVIPKPPAPPYGPGASGKFPQ